MIKTFTISVIIPTYNRAHCVSEAIDSVLAQDPPADEVIVIDDGSTDSTPEVLAGYGDRITVVQQPNAGAGAARTAGLRHASGDWITFLDSDDLWYPGRLALFREDIAKVGDTDVVLHVADVVMTGVGYRQGFFDLRDWGLHDGAAERIEDAFPRALSGLHLNGSAVRGDVARQSKGFPAELKIQQDVYFVCSVAIQGAAVFSKNIVAEVRRIPGDENANVELVRKDPVRAYRIAQRRFDLILELPLTPDQRKLVRRHSCGHLFKLAQAEADAGLDSHRGHLLRMVREHPRKLIAVLKAAPPFVLGRWGYRLLPRTAPRFSRVR